MCLKNALQSMEEIKVYSNSIECWLVLEQVMM